MNLVPSAGSLQAACSGRQAAAVLQPARAACSQRRAFAASSYEPSCSGASFDLQPVAAQPPKRTARRARVSVCCNASSAAIVAKPCIKVAFKIPYRVHFGQSLGLVGSADVLGSWEGSRAVRMEWSQGDLWIAEIEVDPRTAPAQLEYKYVVLNKDGFVCNWKPGKNYTLYVAEAAARGGKRLAVSETWDEGLRVVELDGRMWDSPENTSSSSSSSNGSGSNGVQSGAQSQPLSASSSQAAAGGPQGNGTAASGAPHGSNGYSNGAGFNGGMNGSSMNGGSMNGSSMNGSSMNGGSMHGSSSSSYGGSSQQGLHGWPRPYMGTGVSAIQLEAQAAMSELQEALERQLSTIQRLTDPSAVELLMGDRILAAANLKAVTLNRALRAAQALPSLPPPTCKVLRESPPPPSPSPSTASTTSSS